MNGSIMIKSVKQYCAHRSNAKYRRISWYFTYVSWRKLWAESGYWPKRGNGPNDYVMARFGDKGPYASWNVKIITQHKNSTEGHLGNLRSLNTRKKMSKAAKRVGTDPAERKRRSERAKKQHKQKNFGAHTWKEGPDYEKIANKWARTDENRKQLRSHIAAQSSEEMSRRSYQRKIFQ